MPDGGKPILRDHTVASRTIVGLLLGLSVGIGVGAVTGAEESARAHFLAGDFGRFWLFAALAGVYPGMVAGMLPGAVLGAILTLATPQLATPAERKSLAFLAGVFAGGMLAWPRLDATASTLPVDPIGALAGVAAGMILLRLLQGLE
jgi:hypothetical protein